MSQYSLDCFKNNATIYALAEKYDSKAQKGNDDRILNNNEIKLFNHELSSLGISFDFNQIRNDDYLNEFETNLERAQYDAEQREKLIKDKESEYKIEMIEKDGKKMYKITVLKEVNCSGVSSDLNLPAGAIAKNNAGYDKYSNGTYVGNIQMQGREIYIDINDLNGKTWLNLGRMIYDGIKNFFN